MSKPWAAIFDMDGVVADTNDLHRRAWNAFCRDRIRAVDEADMEHHVYGRTNREILSFLMGPDLDPARMEQLGEAKEALFRESARGVLRPLPGLPGLLAGLKAANVPLALATSAPPDNVAFVLSEVGLQGVFPVVVDSTMVSRSKPEPDIFLAAAERLGMAPGRCLVFEDSLSGVQAAQNAGMAVVGVATTHGAEELAPRAALVVADFQGMSVDRLAALVDAAP